jgi:hypothetical protein
MDFAARCYQERRRADAWDMTAVQRLEQIANRNSVAAQQTVPADSLWRRGQALELRLALAAVGALGGMVLGFWLLPGDPHGFCGELLEGAPSCVILDFVFALKRGVPLALPLALAGYWLGRWLARRFPKVLPP